MSQLLLHSLVLYQCSSFFHQELTTTTKKDNIIEITLTDITVEAFKILIKGDKEPTIFNLLVPSSKLGLAELIEYIKSYLIDNKASWLRLKFIKLLTNLLLFKKNALINLLKRFDLQIEESEIWDKVIQWGKEQTSDLPSNLKQWTEKNF
ncbi:hypothetical protein C2G38_2160625 [Gigaspora rosea]|uniref:BTB domain-containing protein n=1 Tax=Gigaspora rosea TaxID=44941 RepID=A0A397W1D2_9GLOM|nr:hypothetical protein C2G38_2160625 [Gigaspora rosea]